MRTSIDNNTHVVMLAFLLMFTLSYCMISNKIAFSMFKALISFVSAFSIAGAVHLHYLLLDKINYRPGAGIGIGMLISVPLAFIISILFTMPWLLGSWMGSGIILGLAFDKYYRQLHGIKKFKMSKKNRRIAKMVLAFLAFVFLIMALSIIH
jgi:hypothetical protein